MRGISPTAARQHGLITTRQLLALGCSEAWITRAVTAGRLHRVHRGVYAVGHNGLTTQGVFLAAVLACGEGAVLSHLAAAHLLRLIRGAPPLPTVTTPVDRRPRGIDVRFARRLDTLDSSTLDGIPLTTVPRTLLDLAGDLSLGDLARAFHEAHVHHRTTPAMVEAAARRTPNRKGIAKLRQALTGDHLLLGELEAEFVRLLAEAGLPLPRTNVRRAEGRVDCVWGDLVVELDSYRFHATRSQWEEDVRRTRRGAAVLRFTWGDVFERPAATLAELAPRIVQTSTSEVKEGP